MLVMLRYATLETKILIVTERLSVINCANRYSALVYREREIKGIAKIDTNAHQHCNTELARMSRVVKEERNRERNCWVNDSTRVREKERAEREETDVDEGTWPY